jgi:hypothetical protein
LIFSTMVWWTGTRSVPVCCAPEQCAGGDGDTEMTEPLGGLVEAQAQRVVQPGGEAPGVRADLAGRRTQGVGGLLGMVPLDPLLAAAAPAGADGKPGDDRLGVGQLGHELFGVAFVVDHTAAVRATRRQRCRPLPVDRPDRHGTMTVAAVVVARPPSWTLRLLFRLALRERRRLALPRPPGVFEELFELHNTGVAYGQRLGELGDTGFEADDGCGPLRQGGGVIARGGVARRNSPRYARSSIGWWIPLSKYPEWMDKWMDSSQILLPRAREISSELG